MNLFKHYINYRLHAKGRHNIHSPFVYTLINECLSAKVDKIFLSKRKNIFKLLKKNNSTITIADFGAGSKKLGKVRKVSDIFKTSSSQGKYSILLYKISSYYSPKHILELGTSIGIGSIHLQTGNPTCNLTTIEACKNTLELAKANFSLLNLKSINTIHSTFDDFFTSDIKEKFDLVFVDGHHNGDALIKYIEKLKIHTHNDTIFIIDDIRWSESMYVSWKKITEDNYFHVSIDFFRMGIVIPRNQQTKEHFILKL